MVAAGRRVPQQRTECALIRAFMSAFAPDESVILADCPWDYLLIFSDVNLKDDFLYAAVVNYFLRLVFAVELIKWWNTLHAKKDANISFADSHKRGSYFGHPVKPREFVDHKENRGGAVSVGQISEILRNDDGNKRFIHIQFVFGHMNKNVAVLEWMGINALLIIFRSMKYGFICKSISEYLESCLNREY